MLNTFSRWHESTNRLLLLLLFSLLLKSTPAFCTLIINPDGALYISVAQKFATGEFKEAMALFPMPFYPLLITFFHFLIPNWVAAARFISVSTSVLVLIPLYLLTRHLFNQRVAFWSCAAWTLSPVANEWAVEIIREPPFLFLFAWNVTFALRAIESKKLIFFITTVILSGLCALLRIEALAFVPFFLFFVAILALKDTEARGAFLKGIGVWVGFSLGFFCILFLAFGPAWVSFNRMNQVIQISKGFFQFQFLENYHLIFQQLKVFQASLPNPDGGQNLLEIVRHYMPLIYFVGLVESLVKFLFVPFVVLLFLGAKHSLDRNRVFVLFLAVLYIFVVYYRLIDMNFISERYLLIPAFLLYPWIGAGIERLLTVFRRLSHKRLLAAAFITVFVITPVYKSIKPLWQQDVTAGTAGEWIAKDPRLQRAKMMSTDGRIPFYAGQGRDYLKYEEADYQTMRRAALSAPDADLQALSRTSYYLAMEPLALSNRVDLIAIRIPAKKKDVLPSFDHYKILKEFQGKKDFIALYERIESLNQ